MYVRRNALCTVFRNTNIRNVIREFDAVFRYARYPFSLTDNVVSRKSRRETRRTHISILSIALSSEETAARGGVLARFTAAAAVKKDRRGTYSLFRATKSKLHSANNFLNTC